MATGPEHYRASEQAIENAKYEEGGSNKERFFLSIAQVHATLALAAAMGTYGVAEEARTAADANAWEYAAGEYSKQRRQARRDKGAEAEDAAGMAPSSAPVEHVDYAEAEAVREIHEEMALEAAGVERWEDL